MGRERKEHITQSLALSLSNMSSYVILFPAKIVTASILGPSLLGVLKIIELIRKYTQYTSLGMQKAMFREISMAHGRGQEKEIEVTKKVVLSWLSLSLFASIAILWILFICGINFKDSLTLPILIALTVLLLTSRINTYIHSLSKCDGLFSVIAKRKIIETLVYIFLIIPLLIFFRVNGVLICMILSSVGGILYGLKYVKIPRIRIYLPFKETVRHLRISSLLFSNSFAGSVFWTIDTMVIGAMLSLRELGLYAFALSAAEIVHITMGGFNSVIIRQMFMESGKQERTGCTGKFKYYMKNPFAGYMMIAACVSGTVFFMFDFLIKTYLTKFNSSRACLIIVMLGIMIYEARIFANNYLNASHRLKTLLFLMVSGILFNFVLDVALIRQGYGIIGAAWASTISYVAYIIVVVFISLRSVFKSFKIPFLFLVRVFSISLILFLLMYILSGIEVAHYTLQDNLFWKTILGILDVGAKTIVFSIITIFLYCCLFSEEKLWQELKNSLGCIIPYRWSKQIIPSEG